MGCLCNDIVCGFCCCASCVHQPVDRTPMTRVWNVLVSAGHTHKGIERIRIHCVIQPWHSHCQATHRHNQAAHRHYSLFRRPVVQGNSSRGWVVCTRWVVRGTPDDTADSNEFRSHCVPSLSTVMAKHTGYHKHWNTCCCPCLSNSKDGVFSMCGLDTVCVARCLMVVRMESNSSVYSLMNHSELCVVIGATGLWWWSAIACVATGLWWWAGAQRGMESQRVCPTSTCCISSCC